MVILELVVFGLSLIFSVLTIMGFVSNLVEAVVNKRNANYNGSYILLLIAVVGWTCIYYINM
jgi:hypothetical protein